MGNVRVHATPPHCINFTHLTQCVAYAAERQSPDGDRTGGSIQYSRRISSLAPPHRSRRDALFA